MRLVPLGVAAFAAAICIPEWGAETKAQGLATVHISAAGGVVVEQASGGRVLMSATHVIFGFAASADGAVLVTMPGFLSAPQQSGASIKLDGRLAEQLRTGTTSGYETMSVSAGRVSPNGGFTPLKNPLTLIIAQYN